MRLTIIILALICAACGSAIPTIKPYKMDIQQGNVVTSKMMLQLRPGMNKSQVRFIMGTPLIVDSFHRNRWDYFYQMRKAGKIVDQRRVILDFDGDALKSIRGDVVAAGTDPNAIDDVPLSSTYEKPAAKPQEKSLMDKLKFWKKDEVPAEKLQAVPADLAKPETQKPAQLTLPASLETKAPAVDATQPSAPVVAPEPKPVEAPQAAMPKPEAATNTGVKLQQDRQISSPEAEPLKTEPLEAKPIVERKTIPVVKEVPATPKASTKAMPEAKPVTRPEPQKSVRPEPVKPESVKPAEELPPEGDPGYFERMLEKIGF